MSKVYSGIKNNWQVLEQIGKGDAGEVFLVESKDKTLQGILKRPLQIATGGTIIRQASQIETEGEILFALSGLQIQSRGNTLRVPSLLDTSITGTSKTASYFIVSEQASGISLSDLIKKDRSGVQLISQLDLLSIINALLELFNVIHSKGIFWNDVKADHIFFDKQERLIYFIDWGNGRIYSGQAENADASFLSFSDFQQMIQEVGNIILGTKPELIWDLGWPIESSPKLDLHQLKQLEKRVEYAYEYLYARLIEYKSLEKIYYDRADNLDSLKEVIGISQSLYDLGEEVNAQLILRLVEKILLASAQKKDLQACQDLVDYLPDRYIHKERSWEIIRLITSSNEIDKTKTFHALLLSIFDQNWSESLWLLKDMVDRSKSKNLWQLLLNYFRQQVLDFEGQPLDHLKAFSDDLHVELIRQRMAKTDPKKLDLLAGLSASIDQIISNWPLHTKKGHFGSELLDLRTVFVALLDNGIEVPKNLIQTVNEMITLVRSIVNAWIGSDFDLAHQNIHKLFLIDPQFGALIELDQDLVDIEQWTNSYKAGPQGHQSITEFIQNLQDVKPAIEDKLGTPNWLSIIKKSFEIIQTSQDIQAIRAWAVQYDLPISWFFDDNLDFHDLSDLQQELVLDSTQRGLINQFHDQLRKGENLTSTLADMRKAIPNHYLVYEKIEKAFSNIFSALENNEIAFHEDQGPQEDKNKIHEAKVVLEKLIDWRKYIQSDNYITAETLFSEACDWFHVSSAQKTQKLWQKFIRPAIASIKQKQWKQSTNPKETEEKDLINLFTCLSNMHSAHKNWISIERDGLTTTNSASLLETIESAQNNYYSFWRVIEKTTDQPLRLIAFLNQDILASVYQELTQLTHFARNIKNAVDVINQPAMSRTRLAKNSAGDLMFSLVRMDKGLNSNNHSSKIDQWQKTYLRIINISSIETLQEELLSVDRMHPLFAWFLELTNQGQDSAYLQGMRGW